MSQFMDGSSASIEPWYARKDVPLLMYRINRRPMQPNLFDGDEAPPPFLTHLTECLVFGLEVVTKGRGSERHWRLGNQDTDLRRGYVAGWVGYERDEEEEELRYNDSAKEWVDQIVVREHGTIAPFVIVDEPARTLFVALHTSFTTSAIASVFQMVLREGESRRPPHTTEWSVEPQLDEADFAEWLDGIAILDSVKFKVHLPNPDAAEAFHDLVAHMASQGAGELEHKLQPQDPERGLNKDFEANPLSRAFMAMIKQTFGTVNAKGRSLLGAERRFDQGDRVRRLRVRLPADARAALQRVIGAGLQATDQDKESLNDQ